MARKIDTGSEPPAHTAIQAMIGRAQITANRDRKCVAVVCDLAKDQLVIADLDCGSSEELQYIRIVEPGAAKRTVIIRETGSESASM